MNLQGTVVSIPITPVGQPLKYPAPSPTFWKVSVLLPPSSILTTINCSLGPNVTPPPQGAQGFVRVSKYSRQVSGVITSAPSMPRKR